MSPLLQDLPTPIIGRASPGCVPRDLTADAAQADAPLRKAMGASQPMTAALRSTPAAAASPIHRTMRSAFRSRRWRHEPRETVFLVREHYTPIGVRRHRLARTRWRPELGSGSSSSIGARARHRGRARVSITPSRIRGPTPDRGRAVTNPTSRTSGKSAFQWSASSCIAYEAAGDRRPGRFFRLSLSV